MSAIRVAAIIPARMGSTRFPGKPLLQVQGLPMVEHVRRRTLLCKGFSDVVVATCDKEIEYAVKSYGGRVMMTADTHVAATDRVAEAADELDCTHVINVQGDEILVLPEDLARMIQSIHACPAGPAWNALAAIESAEDLATKSIVKCVVSATDRVMYCSRDFSRMPIKSPFDPVRVILGILAYEKKFLLNYSRLTRTAAESIDQNRLVEHDIALQGVNFTRSYPGINDAREAALVENYLKHDARQNTLLNQILPQ
jgi:3-deoxy-manno-octulosonate cytidylyltransferase (CMP-KDO synthetase)